MKYFMIFFIQETTNLYYPFKITRNKPSLGWLFPIVLNWNIVKNVYGSFSNYTFNGFVFHLYVIMTSLK